MLRKKGKFKYITKTGKTFLDITDTYDNMGKFIKGMAKVERNNKEGYINTKGKVIIPCKYDTLTRYENGIIEATLKKNTYYITEDGVIYDAIISFTNPNKLKQISTNKKFGLLDEESGKIVIPAKYDDIEWYFGSLYKVKLKGKWTIMRIS